MRWLVLLFSILLLGLSELKAGDWEKLEASLKSALRLQIQAERVDKVLSYLRKRNFEKVFEILEEDRVGDLATFLDRVIARRSALQDGGGGRPRAPRRLHPEELAALYSFYDIIGSDASTRRRGSMLIERDRYVLERSVEATRWPERSREFFQSLNLFDDVDALLIFSARLQTGSCDRIPGAESVWNRYAELWSQVYVHVPRAAHDSLVVLVSTAKADIDIEAKSPRAAFLREFLLWTPTRLLNALRSGEFGVVGNDLPNINRFARAIKRLRQAGNATCEGMIEELQRRGLTGDSSQPSQSKP